jgi:hypothetical protein
VRCVLLAFQAHVLKQVRVELEGEVSFTVRDLVYAVLSSTAISISIDPKVGRRNRSVILAALVNGLPL